MPRKTVIPKGRFGRLSVSLLSQTKKHNGRTVVLCFCDCGSKAWVQPKRLRSGHTTSCGCRSKENILAGRELRHKEQTVHGENRVGNRSPEHIVWSGIKERCCNPKSKYYYRYGGRGITVCSTWQTSFATFLRDVGRKPAGCDSLDRIDNNKGYEPGNVRWATRVQQANNTGSNVRITHKGETLTVAEWAKRLGVPSGRIRSRLDDGWDPERALTESKHNTGRRV